MFILHLLDEEITSRQKTEPYRQEWNSRQH